MRGHHFDQSESYRNPNMQMDYMKALSQSFCDLTANLESCKALLEQTSMQIGTTLQIVKNVTSPCIPTYVPIKENLETIHTTKAREQGLNVLLSDFISCSLL